MATKETAGKAHAAGIVTALVTVAAGFLAPQLGTAAPDGDTLQAALVTIGTALATGAAAWAAAYYKRNFAK